MHVRAKYDSPPNRLVALYYAESTCTPSPFFHPSLLQIQARILWVMKSSWAASVGYLVVFFVTLTHNWVWHRIYLSAALSIYSNAYSEYALNLNDLLGLHPCFRRIATLPTQPQWTQAFPQLQS